MFRSSRSYSNTARLVSICAQFADQRSLRHFLHPQRGDDTRKRLELEQALAAVRRGDTLVVPKLDRLTRSVPDAREIADALQARGEVVNKNWPPS